MKKGIIVLLITVLAAGLVFADFSGNAHIQFNADFDKKNYGFANGSGFGFSFKIDSEVAKIDGESPIHAVVEATANLIVDKNRSEKEDIAIYSSNGDYGLGLMLSLKTAKIVGENWSIAINGAKSSAYNYASASAIYSAVKNKKDSFGQVYDYNLYAASYSVAYAKAPGVTVTYDGFTGSFGFNHTAKDGTSFSATLETKEFAFSDDMVKVQAAAEASKKAGTGKTNVGVSAKAALALEEVSVKLATDFGFEGIGKDQKATVQFDASLAAAYDFVSATAYVFKGTSLAYNDTDTYKDFYLEATLAADLNKFEVPVSVSFAAANLVDKSEAGIDLSASVDYAKDAISAGASFGLNTDSKKWNVLVYGIYAAEKFTAGANVIYADAVSFGAFAESSAIIEGATIGVNYGLSNSSAMYYGGSYCVSTGYYNNNSFSSDSTTIGTAGAYCIINF